MALSKKKKNRAEHGRIDRKKKDREKEKGPSGEQCRGKHERPQRTSAGPKRQGGREAGIQRDGKTEENKNPLNFSQQQLQNPRSTASSLHPLLPPSTPTSYYFSPMLLSSENRPEARHSPGWLTLKQSPCSLHAGNNLSLLKEPRLLVGSTRTPPPPSPPPPHITPSASEASGLLPRCRCSTRLHVPSLLPPYPSSNRLLVPPDRPALRALFPQLPFKNAAAATWRASLLRI